MGFDRSTSAVWERGHKERLIGQLWLVELVLPSCVANAHQSDPAHPPPGSCLHTAVCQEEHHVHMWKGLLTVDGALI